MSALLNRSSGEGIIRIDGAGSGPMAGSFHVRHLDYDLPESLIAQEPRAERGSSRLLVVNLHDGSLEDLSFNELPMFLHKSDALVLNDTRVLPARFVLRRGTGGRIDGLFLKESTDGSWDVLLRGAARMRPGESVVLEGPTDSVPATLEERGQRGAWRLRVDLPGPAASLLDRIGRAPLPPYIRRAGRSDLRDADDKSRYQTVYAARDGAVAAPTAGLHFTPEMLDQLRAAGMHITTVTLHVGYGTFAPIEVDDLADHVMHKEYYEVTPDASAAVSQVKRIGGRIIAAGTTSVRTLESAWEYIRSGRQAAGWTSLFCYPEHRFHCVDALLTNFHLPRSTLLAMVMAFAGVDLIRKAYAHAVAHQYRFFSYGDAMLIQ